MHDFNYVYMTNKQTQGEQGAAVLLNNTYILMLMLP